MYVYNIQQTIFGIDSSPFPESFTSATHMCAVHSIIGDGVTRTAPSPPCYVNVNWAITTPERPIAAAPAEGSTQEGS